jgi:ABC-type uncharacterized transport system substrate-binding protein
MPTVYSVREYASLAHPGGNLTGLSGQNADLTGKRFELLHEIVPNLQRLAVLFNGNNLAYRLETDIVRAAAIPLGLEVLGVGDDERATSPPAESGRPTVTSPPTARRRRSVCRSTAIRACA